jgi:hypothetical protein
MRIFAAIPTVSTLLLSFAPVYAEVIYPTLPYVCLARERFE